MVKAIQILGYAVGIPLEILAIHAIFRSEYRNYILVFIYVITDFLTTVVEMPNNVAVLRGNLNAEDAFAAYYWMDEFVMQFLAYSIVLSLIYKATANLRSRKIVRLVVFGGALAFTAGSFVYHHNSHIATGLWMTPWARDLSFCAAVLDLALWALLISARNRDFRVLMLSGAFGIQFTGVAIGAAMRSLAANQRIRLLIDLGNIAYVLSYLVFMYILWQAFKTVAKQGKRSAGSAA